MNKEHWEDCARSGSFQHRLQHRCFQRWRLPAFKTRLLYKLWFVGIYSEKFPFILYIFIPPGQSRDKVSLNNYKCILFGLPRKKKRYIVFGWKQRHFQTHALSVCMSSLSCHQGARKAHPYGENVDAWVENKVLHGNIYSSITQRLFSNVQGGQRLTTSERGSVVLALFVSKKSLTNLFLVLDPRHHSS